MIYDTHARTNAPIRFLTCACSHNNVDLHTSRDAPTSRHNCVSSLDSASVCVCVWRLSCLFSFFQCRIGCEVLRCLVLCRMESLRRYGFVKLLVEPFNCRLRNVRSSPVRWWFLEKSKWSIFLNFKSVRL